MNAAVPVSSSDRINSLDVLRGFALLGIFVMNIQVMAMISASYTYPTSFGDFAGANYLVWFVSHVFFDQKMMSIFSLLFGAGIALMADKAMAATGHSAGLHYRRMFWLLLIGLIHAYLIWFGDILVCYALCGMVVYWLRNWNPKVQLAIGLILIAIPSLLNIGFDALFTRFDDGQMRAEFETEWRPSEEKVQQEIADYRGSWLDQMNQRVPAAIMFETFLFGIWSFWRASGLMLVGMAFYRWGILSAERTNRFYVIGAVAGFMIGLPLILTGVRQIEAHHWDGPYTQFVGMQFNYWGSLVVAFAYVGCIMLAVKNAILPAFIQRSIAAVGQMALTNYLLQSIIGTWIFYGHGLGWFGSVDRTGQATIVLAMWVFQLVLSPIWLSRFRFGPFEWLWRTLSYWKVQPFTNRKTKAPAVQD